jgi:hypothetical protein
MEKEGQNGKRKGWGIERKMLYRMEQKYQILPVTF